MRNASYRPIGLTLPPLERRRDGTLRMRALYVVASVGIAVLLIVAIAHLLTRSDAGTGRGNGLAMAEAFGLGGLSSLSPGLLPEYPASPIEKNQIVGYYGSPRTPSMGILGQHPPEEVADLLAERAARFDQLNGDTDVLPAMHLVYAVAQRQPKNDGLYLQYVDDRTVRQFIDLARRRGFILILDLQIGHSDPLAEVHKIDTYLEEPDVFVAFDPEFALSGAAKPGDAIGSIDARDINAVQWYLAAFAAQRHLPKKMLIVHQFQADMVTDASAIERRDGVDLVIDMDGYGPADIKEVKYERYGAASYAPFGGIKLFLEHDPDLLSESALLRLRPTPSLFIYQ